MSHFFFTSLFPLFGANPSSRPPLDMHLKTKSFCGSNTNHTNWPLFENVDHFQGLFKHQEMGFFCSFCTRRRDDAQQQLECQVAGADISGMQT